MSLFAKKDTQISVERGDVLIITKDGVEVCRVTITGWSKVTIKKAAHD